MRWSSACGPGLRVFRDEAGRELFDLPDAIRPAPDTPAPVRFLPEYDNALLGYKDRTRMIGDERRRRLDSDILGNFSTFLVDGQVGGRWKLERTRGTAHLTIEPVVRLSKAERAELTAEGTRLRSFLAPDAERRRHPDRAAHDAEASGTMNTRDAGIERAHGRRGRIGLHAHELGLRR